MRMIEIQNERFDLDDIVQYGQVEGAMSPKIYIHLTTRKHSTPNKQFVFENEAEMLLVLKYLDEKKNVTRLTTNSDEELNSWLDIANKDSHLTLTL